jgi:hypothetical protein
LSQRAAPDFWTCYRILPAQVQLLAERAFDELKADPHHLSLHFKRAGGYWSVRVGLHYRAFAIQVPDGMLWFWLGTHAEYDKLVG